MKNIFSRTNKNASNPNPKGTLIAKVGIIDSTALFFVLKDPVKKRFVAIKEIPVYEITSVENVGNELSVTWKGVTDTFFMEKNAESFGKLRDQINWMLEEQRKSSENKETSVPRRNELLAIINSSIGVVDTLFDVLINLQEKRINWQQLEANSKGFEQNLSFAAQTIPPLNLDFSMISSAIKRKVAKETSKEAFSILKAIYAYFDSLSPDKDIKGNHPNFQNAKNLILAYYTLNDLLLGKIVGDNENKKEKSQLESVLQNLTMEADFRVNSDELLGSIYIIDVESDRQSIVDYSSGFFKDQLKLL
jgi:hypothetical protein